MPRPLGEQSSNDEDTHSEAIASSKTVQQSLQETIFSVLFYMVHGYRAYPWLEYIIPVIEDMLLLVFLVNERMGLIYEIPDYINTPILVPLESIEVTTLYALLTVAYALVFLLACNVAYVAFSIMSGKHSLSSSIALLRLLISTIPTMLQLPILGIFWTVIACGVTPWCTVTPDPGAVAVAIVFLIIFDVLSTAAITKFFDSNPSHKFATSVVHADVAYYYYFVKEVSVAAFILSFNIRWIKALICFAAPAIMFAATLYYQPNYNPRMNQLRGGIYGAHTAVAAIAVGAWYTFTVNGNRRISVELFYSMIGIWLPSFIFCYWYTGYCCRCVQTRCYREIQRKADLDKSAKQDESVPSAKHEDNILVFSSWTHVEITARQFTSYLSARQQHIDDQDMLEIHRVFKRGVQEFPENPQVRLSYATYIFYLQKDAAFDALRHFRKVALLNPPKSIEFQLFFFKQVTAHMREAGELGDGVHLDVTSYAEYRKIDRLARVNHHISEKALYDFWQLLLKRRSDREAVLAEIEYISTLLYNHAFYAERCYNKLVSRFPKSKTYLRLYAKFSYEIMGDMSKGNALSSRAAMLDRGGSESDDDVANNSQNRGRKPRVSISERPRISSTNGPRTDSIAALDSVVVEMPSSSQEHQHGSIAALGGSDNSMPDHQGNHDRKRSMGGGDADEAKSAGTSRTAGDQANSLLRATLRDKLRRELFTLKLTTWLAIFTFIFVYTILFGVIFACLKSNLSGLQIRQMSTFRDYLCAIIFWRVQQLKEAFILNNQAKYSLAQKLLYSEGNQLFNTTWWLFGALGDLELTQIKVNRTFYPTSQVKSETVMTLFQLSMEMVNSAHAVAAVPMSSFGTIATNNYFAFITNNVRTIQSQAWERSSDQNIFNAQSQATRTAIILASTVAAFGCMLAISFIATYIIKTRRFLRRQREGLMVFLGASRPLVKSQCKLWEEILELDMLGMGDSTDGETSADALARNRESQGAQQMMSFLRYALYVSILSALAITALVINISTIQSNNSYFVLAHEFGRIRTYAARLVGLASELFLYTRSAWESPMQLVQTLVSDSTVLFSQTAEMTYGTTKQTMTVQGLVGLDESLQEAITGSQCLAIDPAICAARAQSNNLYDVMLRTGLNKVTLIFTGALGRLLVNLLYGGVDPANTHIMQMRSFFEPDMDDGWNTAQQQLTTLANDLYRQTLVFNYVLLGLAASSVLIGGYFTFYQTITFCDRLNAGIVELISRMPTDVKRAPCFQSSLQAFLQDNRYEQDTIGASAINAIRVMCKYVAAIFSRKKRDKLRKERQLGPIDNAENTAEIMKAMSKEGPSIRQSLELLNEELKNAEEDDIFADDPDDASPTLGLFANPSRGLGGSRLKLSPSMSGSKQMLSSLGGSKQKLASAHWSDDGDHPGGRSHRDDNGDDDDDDDDDGKSRARFGKRSSIDAHGTKARRVSDDANASNTAVEKRRKGSAAGSTVVSLGGSMDTNALKTKKTTTHRQAPLQSILRSSGPLLNSDDDLNQRGSSKTQPGRLPTAEARRSLLPPLRSLADGGKGGATGQAGGQTSPQGSAGGAPAAALGAGGRPGRSEQRSVAFVEPSSLAATGQAVESAAAVRQEGFIADRPTSPSPSAVPTGGSNRDLSPTLDMSADSKSTNSTLQSLKRDL